MSTATVPTSVPPLLEGLVDDAALFPPGDAPMTQALPDYLRHRGEPWGPLLGRFLCPASRVDELVSAVRASVAPDDDVDLGLILDTGAAGLPAALAALEAEPRLVLAHVELRVPAEGSGYAAATSAVVEVLPGLEAYVEVPRGAGWGEALDVVADSPFGAKLRTGGATADAFPSEREVAAFVVACIALETPFKCTAGLHRAVRWQDPGTSFEHHGFLNLLLAVHEAVDGAGVEVVEHLLGERDGSVLARRVADLDDAAAAVTRSFLVAFGSCSTSEPRDDLVRLGLLG